MKMEKNNFNRELVEIGYQVPNPDFIPIGICKEANLDFQKKHVDLLIISVDDPFYEIQLSKNMNLRKKIRKSIQGYGRNVRIYNEDIIHVTEKVLKILQSKYNVMIDF